METMAFLKELNEILDRSFIFRGYKFLLAFYLVVILLAVLAVLFRIGRLYWAVLVSGQGRLHIKKGSYFKQWEENEARLEKNNPSEWKAAVLEAAQMLNEVLEKVGYKNGRLGDKLSQMNENQMVSLEEVRWANELKNRIVREEDLALSQDEARRAVDILAQEMEFFDAI